MTLGVMMNNFFSGFIIGMAVAVAFTGMIADLTPAHVIRECEKDLPRSSQCKLIAVEDKEGLNNVE
jgi:hypothetical protein